MCGEAGAAPALERGNLQLLDDRLGAHGPRSGKRAIVMVLLAGQVHGKLRVIGRYGSGRGPRLQFEIPGYHRRGSIALPQATDRLGAVVSKDFAATGHFAGQPLADAAQARSGQTGVEG